MMSRQVLVALLCMVASAAWGSVDAAIVPGRPRPLLTSTTTSTNSTTSTTSTSSAPCSRDGLKLVFAVWRHGDRNPVYTYPSDPYKNLTYQPDGMENLNNRGKGRAYMLGQLLRRRYGCFLGDELSPGLLALRSTAVRRALQTGGLVMAGLMPPAPNQRWEPVEPGRGGHALGPDSRVGRSLGHMWQPVHFDTVAPAQDSLLIAYSGCPAVMADVREAYSLVGPRLSELGRGGVYEYVGRHAGYSGAGNATTASRVADTLICQESAGLKLPKWTASVYPTPLRQIQAVVSGIVLQTARQRRLQGGVFLNELLNVSRSLVDGDLDPARRMHLYSAHDLSLMAILSALGVWDGHGPTFSSALVVELREVGASGELGLKFLYREGTLSDEFRPLQLPNCDLVCPLDQFQELYKDVILTHEQWQVECNASQSNNTRVDRHLARHIVRYPLSY